MSDRKMADDFLKVGDGYSLEMGYEAPTGTSNVTQTPVSPELINGVWRSMNEICQRLGPLLVQFPNGMELKLSFLFTNVHGAAQTDMRSLRVEKVKT